MKQNREKIKRREKKPKPPPINASGKRGLHPDKKSTNAELERRIAVIMALIVSKKLIHYCQFRDFCEKQWNVSWRTADRYVVRARNELIKRCDKSREELRAEAFGVYESVMRNANAKPADIIRAQDSIVSMLGLEAPRRHEISTPIGGKIEIEHKVKAPFNFEQFRQTFLDGVRAPDGNGAGKSVHPARADSQASDVPRSNGH